MKGKSIDEYTSTFKVLLRRAGWTRDDQSTIKEFVQGLPMWLANRIMARNPPPNKARLSEWIYAARDEVVKDQERMTMLGGYGKRNDIVRDNRQKYYNARPSGNKPRRDPDAMEVNVAKTEGRQKFQGKRLTEEERKKYFKEGQCFRCGKQGHIGHNCPDKKKSPEQNKKKEKSKVREAKIKEIPKENNESDNQEDDSSDETSPPKYTKNEAIIATIKAMPVKSREAIFDYMMDQGF